LPDELPIENPDERIIHALEQTRVFRHPRQKLATFGVTTLKYFVLTEPVYTELRPPADPETVIREGTVVADRPAIVTPSYMLNLEGFGDEARRSLELLARRLGAQSPGVMYKYKNESGGLNIVSGGVDVVAGRIAEDLQKTGKDMAAIIIGDSALWDVSVMKFIYEFTASSLASNLQELHGRGLLDPDPGAGVPRGAVQRIEEMFQAAERGTADPTTLKRELDRWGLFDRYQDRFLGLFRGRRL